MSLARPPCHWLHSKNLYVSSSHCQNSFALSATRCSSLVWRSRDLTHGHPKSSPEHSADYLVTKSYQKAFWCEQCGFSASHWLSSATAAGLAHFIEATLDASRGHLVVGPWESIRGPAPHLGSSFSMGPTRGSGWSSQQTEGLVSRVAFPWCT